jgi:hypothetical protein
MGCAGRLSLRWVAGTPEITATSQARESDFGAVVVRLPLVWITKRVVKVVDPGGKSAVWRWQTP